MNITATIMIDTGITITIYIIIDGPLGMLLSQLIIHFVSKLLRLMLQIIKKLYEHAYPPYASPLGGLGFSYPFFSLA